MEELAMQVRDLLAASATEDITDGELADLARRLSTAQRAMAVLRTMAEDLTLEISARVESDLTPVPGVGVIERGYTRRSNWKDEHSSERLRHDLGEAVVTTISLDLATGELDPVKRNISRATVSALMECLPAFSSIKQPAHRFGIRIGEYRDYGDVPVVRIREDS